MSSRVRFLTVFVCLCLFASAANADNIFTFPTTGNTMQVFSGGPLAEVGRYETGAGPVVGVSATPTGTMWRWSSPGTR